MDYVSFTDLTFLLSLQQFVAILGC